jgi:hypothetical protein
MSDKYVVGEMMRGGNFPKKKVEIICIHQDKLELILYKRFKETSDRSLCIGSTSSNIKTLTILCGLMIISKFSESMNFKRICIWIIVYLVFSLILSCFAFKKVKCREEVLDEIRGKC